MGNMNIHCEWQSELESMCILCMGRHIGTVEEVEGEVCMTLYGGDGVFSHPSLTFNEIEYVMDNWYNMPRK